MTHSAVSGPKPENTMHGYIDALQMHRTHQDESIPRSNSPTSLPVCQPGPLLRRHFARIRCRDARLEALPEPIRQVRRAALGVDGRAGLGLGLVAPARRVEELPDDLLAALDLVGLPTCRQNQRRRARLLASTLATNAEVSRTAFALGRLADVGKVVALLPDEMLQDLPIDGLAPQHPQRRHQLPRCCGQGTQRLFVSSACFEAHALDELRNLVDLHEPLQGSEEVVRRLVVLGAGVADLALRRGVALKGSHALR
mmetsp:Transcript_38713/g.111155  ORF Transcript_38713/g.111155 Transcript_38713/m.111155 type:complete len:255 (-) Transcript_38713:467-1231(-)